MVTGGLDLKRVLLIDNSFANCMNQISNAVPIAPYLGSNPEDNELLKLLAYLKALSAEKNLSVANNRHFRLEQALSEENLLSSIKKFTLA